MALNFYLDGNLVQDPLGWDTLEIVKERDDVIRGLITTYTSKLTFVSDGYDYLKKQFDIQGWCAQIDVTIDIDNYDSGTFEQLFVGKIILSDTVWDLWKKQAECQVVDNTWGALIFARKDNSVVLDVGKSLNGSVFTPTTLQIEFFDNNGVYEPRVRNGVRVFDAFETVINYITDVQVGFVSDCFGAGGIYEGYWLGRGSEIRDSVADIVNGGYPETSFKQLFDELNRKFDLWYGIEMVGNNAYIRVDTKAYFFSSATTVLSMPNARDVKMQINQNGLYNSIKVGDSNNVLDPTNGMIAQIVGTNHEVQQFNIDNGCGIGQLLDNQGTYIWYNHNAIEDLVNDVPENTDYDLDSFLVQYDVGTFKAVQDQPYGVLVPPRFIYNKGLYNSAILNNWQNDLTGNSIRYIRSGDDTFKAHNSVDVTGNYPGVITILPVPLNIEDFDPSNLYDNAIFRYNTPLDGGYVFRIDALVQFIEQSGVDFGDVSLTFAMNSYDALNNNVDGTSLVIIKTLNPSDNITFTYSNYFNILNAVSGGYVELSIVVDGGVNFTNLDFLLKTPSYWQCINAAGQQAFFTQGNSQTMKAVEYSFKYPISYPDFKAVLADMTGRAEVTYDDPLDNITAYIKRVAWMVKTGEADVKLIGSLT
jgi:hypothetical protein